jgi:hypothetical protein
MTRRLGKAGAKHQAARTRREGEQMRHQIYAMDTSFYHSLATLRDMERRLDQHADWARLRWT